MKLLSLIIIFTVSVVSSSFNHPLKLTSSLIEYNAQQKEMKMECRVFVDDFENTINRKNWDVNNLTKEDISEIEKYFDQFYRFTHNFEKLSLSYSSSTVFGANNVLSLKFSVIDLELKKGDDLFIENELFYEEFGVLQSNKMTVRIPPFVEEDYFDANNKQYTVHYKF